MTNRIKEQILKVRDDGRTNMFDVNGVMYVANELRLYELVVYLDDRDNRREYSHFIMTGEAEITDEDSAEDGDDDESSPLTHEEQKSEAIKRLRMLFADEVVPTAYENGTVYLCDPPGGNLIPIPSEMMDEIRSFEREHDALVYLVIGDSWSYSYLYVSRYKEEWEMDVDDLGEGYPLAYVENIGDPECSEFGSIRIAPNGNGGFVRLA